MNILFLEFSESSGGLKKALKRTEGQHHLIYQLIINIYQRYSDKNNINLGWAKCKYHFMGNSVLDRFTLFFLLVSTPLLPCLFNL